MSTAPVVVESPQICELGDKRSRQRLQRRSDIGVRKTSNDEAQADKSSWDYYSVKSHATANLCGFQCVKLREEEDGGDMKDKKVALPGNRSEEKELHDRLQSGRKSNDLSHSRHQRARRARSHPQ